MPEEPVSAPLCTPAAREELAAIVSRAFGIEEGYKELNGAVAAAAGFDLFERIGMDDAPMRLVVAQLLKEAESEGTVPACIEALFLAYPGNAELRDWVGVNVPPLLVRISDEQATAARAAYEEGRQQRRILVLANNLNAVSKSIKPDPALQALLRAIIILLEDLKGYKSVHDILHTLQTKVLGELDGVSRNVDPGQRSDIIADQVIELTLARDDMQALANDFAGRGRIIPNCASIVATLGQMLEALAAADRTLPLTARRAFMTLRAMLRQNMGFFDNSMVETSKLIPFDDVAAALRNFGQAAGAAPPPKAILDKLAVSAQAFTDTGLRLTRRREVHQIWQRLDDILMNVEDLLAGSGRSDELEIHWQDISDQTNHLNVLVPQNIIEVVKRAQPIEVAFATQFADLADPVKGDALKRGFASFIRGVRVQFKSDDAALLRDCRELDRLRAPLEALLEGPP